MFILFDMLAKRRPGFHLSILALSLLMTVLNLLNVSWEVYPSFASGNVVVTTQHAGTDVQKVESDITFPLEEALSSTGGISEMRSVTEAGKSEIRLSFENPDKILKYIAEIREKIERVTAGFSREVRKPIIESSGSGESPALILSIQKDAGDPRELRLFAEKRLKAKIETNSNVGRVLLVGGESYEILIAIDRDRLEAEGLTIDDVIRKIKSNHTYSLISVSREGEIQKPIYLNSKKKEPSDFAQIPLSQKNRGNLFLRDVARIDYQTKDKENFFRRNGKEGLSLYIYPSFRGNLSYLSKEVESLQTEFQKDGILLEIIYDRYSQIRKELFDHFLFSGLLFLFSVLFFFRDSAVSHLLRFVSTTIIVSGIFHACFGSINVLLSIGANVFILLFLILPNFAIQFPQKRFGIPVFQAVWAIVLFFLFQKDFGIFLFQTAFASICFLIVWNFTIRLNFHSFPFLNRFSEADRFFILITNPWCDRIKVAGFKFAETARIYLGNTAFLSRFQTFYQMMKFRFNENPIFGWIAISIISVLVIVFTYKSYSVRVQRQILLCMVELPSGTGVKATDTVSKKVEALLLQSDSIEETVAKVEKDHSRILIRLKDGFQANSELISKLKKLVGKQSPAFVFFTTDSDRNSAEESTFEILGSDPKTIHDLVQSVAKQVTAFPETEEVVLRYKGPREELLMNVDPGKSSQSLLDSSKLGEDLRLTLQGGIAAKTFSDGKEFDVRVRGSAEFRGSKDSMEKIHVRNSEGKFVPLGEVTFGQEDFTPVKVFHKYRSRYLAFSVKFRDKSSGDRVALENRILAFPLPFGYRIEKAEQKTSKIFETLGDANAGFYLFLFVLILSRIFQIANTENRIQEIALYLLRVAALFSSIRFLCGEWKADSYLYFLSLGLFL